MKRSLLKTFVVAAIGAACLLGAPGVRAESASDALIAGWIDRLRAEAAAVSETLSMPTTTVAAGYTLREHAVGPRVSQLSQRLAELGYIYQEAVGPVFTAEIRAGVEDFQADRGLFVDGLAGPQTIAELNRSPRESLAALSWTIERMEAMRADLPDEFLLINIPSLDARLIRDGRITMDMAAAVGRPTRRTPLLTDRIVSLVLNPRWMVPQTIMREDVLPRLRAVGNTGIVQSTVILNGQVVDPATVDWQTVSPWQVAIRQAPGNFNALGRYLFSLTNGENIFVHDTNHPGVFQHAHRWVSSGCIRVSEARRLAEYLVLRNGNSIAELDRALASNSTWGFPLTEPLAVYTTYWMATVTDDGSIAYHHDVYSWMTGYEPSPTALAETDAEPEAGPIDAIPAEAGEAQGTES